MKVFSFFVNGLTPEWLTVEYSSRFQVPGFQILGLPSPEIQEARDRIISAFQASNLEFPKKRILINLAPASIRKSGTGHDLAIALKILSESIELPFPPPVIARGELGLDGTIRPSGRMAHLISLLESGFPGSKDATLILGRADARELRRLLDWRAENGFQNPSFQSLIEVEHLRDLCSPSSRSAPDPEARAGGPFQNPFPNEGNSPQLLPLSAFLQRVLKVACTGRHHTLLLGPKGTGKSACLDWFRALAPAPGPLPAWERALYQESRNESPGFDPPVRQVHSQVRPAQLLGSFHSGSFRAGELSMAHGGLLFADEFPEWPRDSKECLREPLQSEGFHLTSVRGTLRAKCDLQLIGSGNLCPCGGLPLRFRSLAPGASSGCRCSMTEVNRYLSRLSGPILDRIDLWALDSGGSRPMPAETVAADSIRLEVAKARNLVLAAHGSLSSRIPPAKLERLVPRSRETARVLDSSGSLRNRHKLIRIACSIAALEGRESPADPHFREAHTFRLLEPGL
jgi:magnesium chelatase family protein